MFWTKSFGLLFVKFSPALLSSLWPLLRRVFDAHSQPRKTLQIETVSLSDRKFVLRFRFQSR